MKFSIITCSYNCLEGLKAARAQVLAQKGVEVEHIIIDGGSTDGTKEWLEKVSNDECRMTNVEDKGSTDPSLVTDHSPRLGPPRYSSLVTHHSSFQWLSEPDKGLYDALNKGLHLATGDIIGVLHCDDVWEHDEVLAHVEKAFRVPASAGSISPFMGDSCTQDRGLKPSPESDESGTPKEYDAVYGDLYYVDAADITRIRRVWRSGFYHTRAWYNGWMPPHTALFVRREAALRVGDYRLDHGSAADYEWMLRAGLVHHLTLVHLPEVILRMRVGGASNQSVQRRLEAHKYDQLAWERNALKPYPWTLKLKPVRKIPQWLRALKERGR